MKKISIIALVLIAALAAAFGMKGDRTIDSQKAFALRDGESVAYTYDMTSFRVSFAIKEGELSSETLKQDGPLYTFAISRLDSTAPELEFNFRIPGKDTFIWKGLAFDLEFIDLDGDKAMVRITKP